MRNLRRLFKTLKTPYSIIFLATGIASTIWFLVRVIPKPSRANYPCMKVAAPFMSALIIWILSICTSFVIFKKLKKAFIKKRPILIGILIIGLSISIIFTTFTPFSKTHASIQNITSDHLAPTSPMGTAKGIFPGRVTWAWDSTATNKYCTNDYNNTSNFSDDDGFFLPKNSNQEVIDKMLASSVQNLSGQNTTIEAWNEIFKHFNTEKYGLSNGYTPSEKIFIKINSTTSAWLVNKTSLGTNFQLSWKWNNYGITETSPQIILSLLRELVDSVGIAQENIYVGEPIGHVWAHVYDLCVVEYPNVHYVDQDDYLSLGRTLLNPSSKNAITYSDNGTIMPEAVTEKIFLEMENADYLINLAALKCNERAGVSLCANNHMGSTIEDGAGHLHPGMVDPDGINGNSDDRTSYGLYRSAVDIMGCDYLGGNTLLYLIDGLWGSGEEMGKPVKWQTAPFNNDFPNSIFTSLDPVAIESVCYDFLRAEFDNTFTYPETDQKYNIPNLVGVDDYLEQAASETNWPTGIIYSPNGKKLPSLGTHEHWNNSADKKYSRNLGSGNGIELLLIDYSKQKTLNFKITDFTTLKPIENATINIEGIGSKTTDSSGKAIFNFIHPDSTISYTVNHNYYLPSNKTIFISDKITNINDTLKINQDSFYSIEFNVFDKELNALENCEIILNQQDTIRTNIDGNAIFNRGKKNTNISYQINKTGFLPLTSNTILNNDITINQSLTKVFDIHFNVMDQNLNPISNATIKLTGHPSQSTSINGESTFNNIISETDIVYNILAENYLPYMGNIYLSDKNYTLNIILSNLNQAYINTSQNNIKDINSYINQPSSAHSYILKGFNIKDSINISSSSNFEISKDNTLFTNYISITPKEGDSITSTIYVRASANANEGTITGQITHSSTNTNSVIINLEGTSKLESSFIIEAQLLPFITNTGIASNVQEYTIFSNSIEDSIFIEAPERIEISLDGISFEKTLSIKPQNNAITPTQILVRVPQEASVGNIANNIYHTSGKNIILIGVSGIVNEDFAPLMSIPITLNMFNSTLGQPSNSQTYNIFGTNLTNNIQIECSQGFEISIDDITFSSSLSVAPPASMFNPKLVYIRSSANASLKDSIGEISHVSDGATSITIPVYAVQNSTVSALNRNIKAKVFPIPTNGVLNIEVNNLSKIEVYNINGSLADQYFTNQIDISNLNNGVYYLQIFTNEGTETIKVILKK